MTAKNEEMLMGTSENEAVIQPDMTAGQEHAAPEDVAAVPPEEEEVVLPDEHDASLGEYEDADDSEADESDEDTEDADGDTAEPAAKAPRRRAPRKKGPKVIEGDMAGAIVDAFTPEQEKQHRWRKLVIARKDRTIIEQPIAGVEPARDGAAPRVFLYHEDFKIVISTREFFDANLFRDNLDNVSLDERNEREFRLASRMVGAYIPFIITNTETYKDKVSGKTFYVATGSRKEALRLNRERNFFRGMPRVNVGDRIKVRVLMPTSKGLIVDALGVEVVVPSSRLSSCKWIDPLADFPSGTVAYMEVAAMDINAEDKTVDLRLTRQTIDADDALANYNSVRPGTRIHGTVVAVDKEYVRINLDCHVRAAAPVIATNGQRLRYGDRVSVAVRNKKDSTRTVYGSCLPIARRTV